ncbi:hypothetical protein EVAR_31670_1 [Eumeta japonica]|uniref:Uncharacterized protein n=1 Tax=Eumeta variegata TaxID=151549 RepID=A0A4C1VVM9_EUMVA|nr:hypothetical protein EVAR_31670_1 [Eumeta japonica]
MIVDVEDDPLEKNNFDPRSPLSLGNRSRNRALINSRNIGANFANLETAAGRVSPWPSGTACTKFAIKTIRLRDYTKQIVRKSPFA